jgi:hypothetical protein
MSEYVLGRLKDSGVSQTSKKRVDEQKNLHVLGFDVKKSV